MIVGGKDDGLKSQTACEDVGTISLLLDFLAMEKAQLIWKLQVSNSGNLGSDEDRCLCFGCLSDVLSA